MAVRSFKLKIMAGQNEKLRKALWKTHELHNYGVAYYMEWLSLLRQEDLFELNEEITTQDTPSRTKERLQEELWTRVREAQHRNEFTSVVNKQEVLETLRLLYEQLVPSAAGESGEANQICNKYLYPLTDANSQSGKGTASSGRKPRWKNLKGAGDPSWEEEKKKWAEQRQKDPKLQIMNRLDSYGLLPLFPLFTDSEDPFVRDITWLPKSKKQSVRKWDKDMFNQAIERFLSWESWNQKVKTEYEELASKYKSLKATLIQMDSKAFDALGSFEEKRIEELKNITTFHNSTYYLGTRELRGWKVIVDKWIRFSENKTFADYIEVYKDYQRSHSRESGDFEVYNFLSHPENHFIWRNNKEFPFLYAKYSETKLKLMNAKKQATFTLSDPIEHPLWVRFEERSGTNLNKYKMITSDEQKESEKRKVPLTVEVDRFIVPNGEDGYLEEAKYKLQLAPSRQFYNQVLFSKEDEGKGKHQFKYVDEATGMELNGYLGGARIQFDRNYIRRHSNQVAKANVGKIYFNMTLNIVPLQEIGRTGRLQTAVGKALSTYNDDYLKVVNFKPKELTELISQSKKLPLVKGPDSLKVGLRIMSVDLGQRQAAAVSFFEVSDIKPENKLYYPIKDTELFAVHNRSLNLKLAGEKRTTKREKIQNKRDERIRELSRKLTFLRNILNLQLVENVEERKKKVGRWLDREDSTQKELYEENQSKLKNVLYSPQDVWIKTLKEIYSKLEHSIGREIHEWRSTISDDREGVYGISLKNIEEIERSRRLLLSWSNRSTEPGQPKRLEKGKRFAIDQQVHLNDLKDDRIKKMANLLVMTALGYKYRGKHKRWVAERPACQVVLFEDLSEYGFREERSRQENSKLMRWSRREIPRQVALQGELYGLQVGDIGAQFSSRFHAKTGAPGIRCHKLTEMDMQNDWMKKDLIQRGFIKEEQIELIKAGDYIPSKGGEKFATLSRDRSLILTDADINAAQNLQKRFWTRNHGFFRISCYVIQSDDGQILVPKEYTKKRLQELYGSSKGYFIMIDDNKGEVYKWVSRDKLKQKVSLKSKRTSEETEAMNDIFEIAEEISGESITLYRDPSGQMFRSDLWYTGGRYFGTIEGRIKKQLKQRIQGGLKRPIAEDDEEWDLFL
ncbi:hypothetical protein JOD43_000043 [Pullulanibacillus pueri]|uniref:Uncharacterized protein n=1 Tax=Pullulanibacillus pueri TaxID=1437324 RepID=A0A8J2ZS68_9BACL|nr:type V CRISPR-associated protein Cas12b [Pullulanibacillus pueri]MBM7679884.1 hypothetical protein [Pullulanibacillus pueri]GGH73307.1 hypothetical protein GCM10007096_00420 [Pullulanibacillus pueri]